MVSRYYNTVRACTIFILVCLWSTTVDFTQILRAFIKDLRTALYIKTDAFEVKSSCSEQLWKLVAVSTRYICLRDLGV